MLIVSTPTSVPTIAGCTRARVLATSEDYCRLAEFSAGDTKRSEREVTQVVDAAVAEAAHQEHARSVVALEAQSGSWIGVGVINPIGNPPYMGVPYIEAIGTSPAYRGVRLADELTRPGTALLLGVLEVSAKLAGNVQAPPAISAWVLPDNRASHYLFDAFGFEHHRAKDHPGWAQDVRFRRAGGLRSRLSPEIYLPPSRP